MPGFRTGAGFALAMCLAAPGWGQVKTEGAAAAPTAAANKGYIAASMELAKAATRFDKLTLPADLRRKLTLLKLAASPLPAPSDPKLQTELTETASWLEGTYGKGKYCRPKAGAPDGK